MSVERTDLCAQPLMVESGDHSIVCRSCTTFGGGEFEICFYVPMCFLPKRRASMDHAPGPIMATVAPRVARMIGIQGSPT